MKNRNIKEEIINEYGVIAETPSGEIWDKIENSLNNADIAVQNKKTRQTWHKNIIKFALSALMILGAFCFQIFGGNIAKVVKNSGILGTSEVKSGNWFSLVAYASEDTTFEITKDMKVLLPAGNWVVEHLDSGIGVSWRAAPDKNGGYIPGGFIIQGENMKSVNVMSKNGTFSDNIKTREFFMNASAEELDAHYREHGHYRFHVNPVYLSGEDILNLQYFNWTPEKLINSRLEGNYKEYYSDIITITVTFNDDEVLTRIAEITIDEDTGEMFAQIIG